VSFVPLSHRETIVSTILNAGQVVNSSIEDHKYVGTMESGSAAEVDSQKKIRRTKASSDKQALMKVIAQEMVDSLLGNLEDGDEEAIFRSFNNALSEQGGRPRRPKRPSAVSKPKKKRTSKPKLEKMPESSESLADLYYSRMAGEEYGAAKESFAGLSLGDADLADEEELRKSSFHSSASPSERSDATRLTTNSSFSENDGELSACAIREHVMASVPKEIRDQIPEEMWKQIFEQHGSSEGSQSDSNHRIDEIPVSTADDVGSSIGDDEISACSNLTGLTDAFPAVKPVSFSKRSSNNASTKSMAGTEISDLTQPATSTDDSYDIDSPKNRSAICPTLSPYARRDMDPFDEKEDSPFSDKPRSSTERSRSNKSKNLKAPPFGSSKRPSGSSQTGNKQRGSIKFDHVEVRYYERVISDNPSVQSGPAIGIGWRFTRGKRVDVDEWEFQKSSVRKSTELVLSRAERELILREAGCTRKEIAEMVRATLKVKNQRITTVNNLSAAGIEEAVETAKKKVASMLMFGREKDRVKNKY
jgi:hypothetical protein